MKTKIAVAAVAAALGLGLLGAAGAYAGMNGMFERNHEKKVARFINMRVENMLDDISASDPQRQQVNQIKDELFEQGKALHASMQGAHQEFRAQWLSDRPDVNKVNALVDERIDALRGFAHKAVDAAVRLHGVLTPQQREKLAQMHEQEHEGHGW
jgi:protein CpxP